MERTSLAKAGLTSAEEAEPKAPPEKLASKTRKSQKNLLAFFGRTNTGSTGQPKKLKPPTEVSKESLMPTKKNLLEGHLSTKATYELAEKRNVVPLRAFKLPLGGSLFISKGSVVDFTGDAIVNAANEGCITGGGVDGAISKKGGKVLQDARWRLKVVPGTTTVRCRTGDAVITPGGNLDATYCIHAVGPNYSDYESVNQGDDLLFSAYQKAMLRGEENSIQTIGFSLISSGIFRYPQSLENVLLVAIKSVSKAAYTGLEEIHLVAFQKKEAQLLCTLADEYFRVL
mmetsp:Transcript_745/g.1429  ORF Transcript_745/g.1429 Transcript_745/m.1429 type:complete len:286 (+) Transcript_745:325-1182(+)